ncbi:hypothetical protein ABZ383_33785 [Streptomyces sp. NPDC005900]|uniref:hypothetical protein n=1 Tax=Streptomyces sp. NPDC005900 TaxID=3154569 RepID=UPI0033D2353F
MSNSDTQNGQIPTNPAAVILTLCTLCLLINLLDVNQRESLDLTIGLFSLITPYLRLEER